MVSEGTLNISKMISDEIIERTRKESAEYYLTKINYLKSLLIANDIPFDLESEPTNN